ncbi:hypothetical protein G9A89_021904 [Geosiphon pyriformis]|nr:hypothetical protein G9A89_021904 [Geosiphon pyriformis]
MNNNPTPPFKISIESPSVPFHPNLVVGSKLSMTSGFLVCTIFTLGFVGGLYVFPGARIGGQQRISNHHPRVIVQRMKAVVATCFFSFLGVWAVLNGSNMFIQELSTIDQLKTTFTLVGLNLPYNFLKILSIAALPLLLTCTLFLGPLTILLINHQLPFQSHFSWRHNLLEPITSLLGFRTYIFAPLAEEFVFRCCMVPILVYSGYHPSHIIFYSPLFFGIAHLHHAWEYFVNNGRDAIAAQVAIQRAIFQLLYTTLFGWLATFLFLRTGISTFILAPFLSHSFCNIMGFPSIDLEDTTTVLRYDQSSLANPIAFINEGSLAITEIRRAHTKSRYLAQLCANKTIVSKELDFTIALKS